MLKSFSLSHYKADCLQQGSSRDLACRTLKRSGSGVHFIRLDSETLSNVTTLGPQSRGALQCRHDGFSMDGQKLRSSLMDDSEASSATLKSNYQLKKLLCQSFRATGCSASMLNEDMTPNPISTKKCERQIQKRWPTNILDDAHLPPSSCASYLDSRFRGISGDMDGGPESSKARTANLSSPRQLADFFKRRTPHHSEEEGQQTIFLSLKVAFSSSTPISYDGSQRRLVSSATNFLGFLWENWLQLLDPAQDGGSGNGNGNWNSVPRICYDGDDNNEKKSICGKHKNTMYHWCVLWLAVAWGSVCTFRIFSGLSQPATILIGAFVDCVLWIGLLWCIVTILLWTARMVFSICGCALASTGLSLSQLKLLASAMGFLTDIKLDERMAQNIGVLPGLVLSAFLVSDLLYYLKHLSLNSSLTGSVPKFFVEVGRCVRISFSTLTDCAKPFSPKCGIVHEKRRIGGSKQPSVFKQGLLGRIFSLIYQNSRTRTL